MTDEQPAESIEGRVEQLLRLLDVRATGELAFTGSRQPGGVGRVFGGQVIAQGLIAAMRTVDPAKILHSLHCYFMRAGDESLEIDYQVRTDFDGGSFSTRRIIALQADRPILTMTASFHKLESGFAHQSAMPNVPEPEALLSENDRIAQESDPATAALLSHFQRIRPVEVRPVERRSFAHPVPQPPISHSWLRLGSPLSDLPLAQALAVNGDDANLHRAILAYASDMMLLGTCVLPHGVNWRTPGMMTASLDHALWIHDDFRIDDWLLYATDSTWSGRARGFNRGQFFTRDGRLVASVAQEGLIRYRAPAV